MNLYLGTDQVTGLQYLLTAYDDGTLTIATRPDDGATWSAPVALEPEVRV